MAVIPRYRLHGLQVTAYDADDDTPNGIYTDIVTSERDSETGLFGKLGTVFSIKARGYSFELDDGELDEVDESVAIRYEGASRLCFAPTTTEDMHPEQILAFVAWYNVTGPLIYDVDYSTPETTDGDFGNGVITTDVTEKPERFYFTLVYDEKYRSVQFYCSLNPEFTTVGDYPVPWGSVAYVKNDGEQWIMSYVTVEEFTEEEPEASQKRKPAAIIGYVLRLAGVPMAELVAQKIAKSTDPVSV